MTWRQITKAEAEELKKKHAKIHAAREKLRHRPLTDEELWAIARQNESASSEEAPRGGEA